MSETLNLQFQARKFGISIGACRFEKEHLLFKIGDVDSPEKEKWLKDHGFIPCSIGSYNYEKNSDTTS